MPLLILEDYHIDIDYIPSRKKGKRVIFHIPQFTREEVEERPLQLVYITDIISGKNVELQLYTIQKWIDHLGEVVY
jgi:hypothetical protein